MDARTTVRGWLQTLGNKIGTKLDLPENGVCGIGFGDGRVCAVEVPADGGPLVVHAPVVSLAGREREAIFRKALTLSLFGAETGGFAFGYDESRDRLLLWASRSPAALDETSFQTLVSAAIATAVKLELAFAAADEDFAAPVGDGSVPTFATRV